MPPPELPADEPNETRHLELGRAAPGMDPTWLRSAAVRAGVPR